MEMKYDDGKLKAHIMFEDFPLALQELVAVCTYGDLKYERSSWKTVPDAKTRYSDAKARHIILAGTELLDEESRLYHLAHEAWNCLALLQLELEAMDKRDYTESFANAKEAKQRELKKANPVFKIGLDGVKTVAEDIYVSYNKEKANT